MPDVNELIHIILHELTYIKMTLKNSVHAH